jgi:hypothetical protein
MQCITQEPSEDASPGVPSETRSHTTHAEVGREARASTPHTSNLFAPVTDSTPGTEGVSTPPGTSQEETELRRSTRSTAGKFQTARYADVFLARVEDFAYDSNHSQVAYMAELQTYCKEGTINISDPRVYAAKSKDAENPSFHEAMHGDAQEQYLEEMKVETASLLQQSTWKCVPLQDASHAIKSTWVFKLKRSPDGTPSKYKARFCVRGDLQKEGLDFFETYAPVWQWSTVRMILTMVLLEGWATKQVDNTNAFAQAEMKETLHIEPPKLFGAKSGNDMVLIILKSLYGLKHTPITFYENLIEGLLEQGFTKSEIDPCLFTEKGCICVMDVDDTIFAGPEEAHLEQQIKSLGVAFDEFHHSFQL